LNRFHDVEDTMTVQSLKGFGCCAHLDTAGDWAYDAAFSLARQHGVVRDVVFFPEPCGEDRPSHGRRAEFLGLSDQAKIELEKNVRLFPEDRLGGFLEMGYGLGEGDEEPELRRCLIMRRDDDLLVLPDPSRSHRFGGRPIEACAQGMPCPTILIGPEREQQLFVNSPARIWVERVGLGGADRQGMSLAFSRDFSFAGPCEREEE
jgi:hypothetical protein